MSENPTQPDNGAEGLPANGAGNIVTDGLPWWEKELNELKDSATTPERRAEIAERLTGKVKGYETAYTRKTQELSAREQEIRQVAENLKAAQGTRQEGRAFDAAQEAGLKKLDALMKNTADPQARETLRDLRDIIAEETELPKLRKELEELRSFVNGIRQETTVTRAQGLDKEISELSRQYGQIVEKHSDQIKKLGVQYPQFNAEKLLYSVADPDEIRQALVVQSKKTKGAEVVQNGQPAKPTSSEEQHISQKFFKSKAQDEMKKSQRNLILDRVKWAGDMKERVGLK